MTFKFADHPARDWEDRVAALEVELRAIDAWRARTTARLASEGMPADALSAWARQVDIEADNMRCAVDALYILHSEGVER